MMDKYKELLERLDGVKHEIGFVGLALGEGYAWAAKVLDEAAAAIEELSEQNDNLREAADTANEYANHLLNVKRHETCTDCPLYDKDKHRCPRFNAVIPRAIEESQRAQRVESDGNALDELSPAERKKGKWIRHSIGHEHTPWGFDCSECGRWFVVGEEIVKKYNFCPNCGADMRGE